MKTKLSHKDFEKILTSAGITFDFWGYEGILNIISLYQRDQERKCNKAGLGKAAEDCRKRYEKIESALLSRGYNGTV